MIESPRLTLTQSSARSQRDLQAIRRRPERRRRSLLERFFRRIATAATSWLLISPLLTHAALDLDAD